MLRKLQSYSLNSSNVAKFACMHCDACVFHGYDSYYDNMDDSSYFTSNVHGYLFSDFSPFCSSVKE